MHGILRWIAKSCDRSIVSLNTQCYADSSSQKDFLVAKGVGSHASLSVLGAGSLSGVDVNRWEGAREQFRKDETRTYLGLPLGIPVIVFVGRVTRDKGIVELLRAAKLLDSSGIKSSLVIVGPLETGGDVELERELAEIRSSNTVHLVGYDPHPDRFLANADILCLPSYREGFGNVVIEAAVMGIPSVGTSIVGLTDSVVTGVTGLLVPPKNAQLLADSLLLLLRDAELREKMGKAARERALRLFDARQVNDLLLKEYQRLQGLADLKNAHSR
jgi:glycosyltransferase involved in cell wall biosynthesis